VRNLITHWLGLDDSSSRIYLGWSAGADLSELTLIAIPAAYLRHHQRHEPRCRRIGHRGPRRRRPMPATPREATVTARSGTNSRRTTRREA
jgi:hypothetical protein